MTKLNVPIGLTTANNQASMPTHMEYQVALPNHDFVVIPKHKFIPSVIGDMKLVKSKDLTNDASPIQVLHLFKCQAFSIICICPFSRYDEGMHSA